MPTTPPNDPLPPGWATGIFLTIAAFVGALANRAVSALNRKTALETKAIDSKDEYTKQLAADLTQMRAQIKDMGATIITLQKEGFERQELVSHLKIEVDRLNWELSKVRDEGRMRQQEYEEQIDRLQNELIDKQNEINRLEQQIADFEHIGVGETPPPKRMKGKDDYYEPI